MTHDFKRQGTTTLFAAFHVLDGQVIGECLPRHRHQEFLKFLRQIDRETPPALELHLIVDNYSTHKHEQVKKWLAKRSSPLSGQLRHKISSPKSSAPPKSTPLSRTVSGTTLATFRRKIRVALGAGTVANFAPSKNQQLTGAFGREIG